MAEAITKGLSGGPIGLKAVALPYRDAKGRVSIPVVLEVDGRALLEGGASKQLPLEIYGYALDGAGQIRDAFGLTPVLDLGAVKPALQAKGLQVISSFAAPEGKADLRFVVRDKASGRAGSLRMTLDVPAFGQERWCSRRPSRWTTRARGWWCPPRRAPGPKSTSRCGSAMRRSRPSPRDAAQRRRA